MRIKVQACGICHSDSLVKEGHWPGLQYPRVPGHEVVGMVDAVGAGVAQWKPGQRVGVGWHGGHCGYCDSCRSGDFFACQVALQITGISFDGGYADYMVAPAIALALVPDDLPPVDAAPLMCAGHHDVQRPAQQRRAAGDLVAVLGLGGLGHLGVQYAAKMGFKTVAIARGKDKEPLARKLGAHHYIDSQAAGPGGGIAKARRREGHPRHGDERRRDERGAGRPGRERDVDRHRRGASRCRSRRSCCSPAAAR